ncbi:hypothetical protein [Halobacillus campisalis]|uniref:hypothetical protein n=1 Tax=Halobacillus campisalis TaxID=435909 RepID=UPI0036F2F3B9
MGVIKDDIWAKQVSISAWQFSNLYKLSPYLSNILILGYDVRILVLKAMLNVVVNYS